MVRRESPAAVARVTETLQLHNGGFVLSRPADASEDVQPKIKSFNFTLCRKASLFGEVPVDQFWFEYSSIYKQRNYAARNFAAIVDFFWTLCWRERTVFEDDVQESYILAKLLPDARSNGSRRVLNDAVPSRAVQLGQGKYDLIPELNERLQYSRSKQISLVDFHRETANLLGPPDYPPDIWVRYREKAEELLGEGRQALARAGEAGLATPLERWRGWMRTVARRRGNELDKQVLDIFSYECRAALHRCYSAVWSELLPHLTQKYDLTPATVRFHHLWHLDPCMAANEAGTLFHLFHGHVFGLHPGTGIFVRTKVGTELIGEVLEGAEPGPAFGRLLNGLLIAMHHYADRHETVAEARREPPAVRDHEFVDRKIVDSEIVDSKSDADERDD